MPNRIVFSEFNERLVGLTKTEVKDLVDVLYRTADGNFIIHGVMRPGEKPTIRGLCVSDSFFGSVEIYLAPDRIVKSYHEGRPVGGNRPALSPKLAVAAVLAHELQHANQYRVHSSTHSSFFGKKRSKYRARASEREARNFADEHVGIIAHVLGIELPRKSEPVQVDTIEMVAHWLADVGEVGIVDIVEELRGIGMNNAANVAKVKELLILSGAFAA